MTGCAYYAPLPPLPRAAPAAPWREYDDALPPVPVSGAHYDHAYPVPSRYPSSHDRSAWANPLPLPTGPRATGPYDHYASANDQGRYDLPPPAPAHDDGRYDAPSVPRTRTHRRGSESLDTERASGAPYARPPRSNGTEEHDNAYRPPPAISSTWRPADDVDMDVDRVPPTWSRSGRDRPMYPADPYAPYDAHRAPPPPPPHPWAAMRRALPPKPEEYYPHRHHHPHSYPEYAPAHRPSREYWMDDDPRDAPLPSRPMSWPMPPRQQDSDRSPSDHWVPRTVPPPSSSSAPGPSPTTSHARPEVVPSSGSGSGSGSNQASSTSTAPPATMRGGYFFDEENDHMVVGKRREFFVFNRAYYMTMVLCLQNKAPIPRDVEIRRWKRLMKSLTLLPNYESEPFRCLAWTGGNLIITPVEDWAAILAAVHVDSTAGSAHVSTHRSITQTCKVLGETYQMRRSRCGIPAEYVEAFCRRCTGCRTITPAATVVTVSAGQVEEGRGEPAERAA
ncbi:hypothetical protein AMAG_05644 [Allomyces macrogynus ATCC 38327]|uniref:Uncharacterized protein n=1 Tax=Allomyces macrogynus (strain ATCC 38327) TaxID=578462 RepID=A0A0L0SCF6_ALLM3|nr:hypothetical protein AMAG_05644 [Allomyces macrogynus ATCC 38327]|eukprot:KNE60233.1 hypothetical protein AMAG_05644 [Allomyces macrogynus ATCC 38327]